MWNLQDDNEFDKLSREAAEHYPMDRSPDSWNKIHQRLDAEMPTERRRRYLLLFLLFLFVGSGAFWLTRMNADDLQNQQLSQESPPKLDQQSPSKTFDASVTPKRESAGSTAVAPNATGVKASQIKPEGEDLSSNSVSPINSSTKNSLAIKPEKRSAEQSPVNTTNNRTSRKSKRNQEIQDKPIVREAAVDEEKVNNETKVALKSNDETEAVKEESTNSPKGEAQQTDPLTSKADEQKTQTQESSTKSKEKDPKSKMNTRWTIGAVYAPDISTVKFTHTQPAGMNIGVQVEYSLSKKFSLQSGLIYTKKNYKMNGEDYHPPKGNWFDYVKLEDVTGDCSMFDIPLNVRFNAVRKKASNIFVGAGLSTYLMKEENYSYFYYYNGNPTTRDRSYDANSSYVLSILNISAGFEKKLTNAFSLQVEPFFKQPLTGLGFGEISLNSTGVYFSLRFNPLKPARQQVAPKN